MCLGEIELVGATYLDNHRISQVALVASGDGTDSSMKPRYTLEITSENGFYELVVENSGYPRMCDVQRSFSQVVWQTIRFDGQVGGRLGEENLRLACRAVSVLETFS